MTKLSVNINKVATLRNARGGNNPDVVKVALDCEAFGAEGITVHPRPDERHIRRSDVYELRPLLTTEFNIEGYPSPEFVDLVLKVKPHQVTLVPDAPDQITSNAGWDTKTNLSFLTELMDLCYCSTQQHCILELRFLQIPQENYFHFLKAVLSKQCQTIGYCHRKNEDLLR